MVPQPSLLGVRSDIGLGASIREKVVRPYKLFLALQGSVFSNFPFHLFAPELARELVPTERFFGGGEIQDRRIAVFLLLCLRCLGLSQTK